MLPKVGLVAIVLIIFGLIFFDVGLLTSRYLKPSIPFLNSLQNNKQASISGVIRLNGPIPQGSSISIGIRDHASAGDYAIFASGLPATDDSSWQYTQAEEGKSYQLQAYLDLNGTHNSTSDPLTVTAPAGEEELTINIISSAPSQETATISGTLYINGYIPQGAVFDLLARPYGSTGNYSVVVNNLSAQVQRTLSYSSASSGQKYEIKGQLFDTNGTVIGESPISVISAPSDNAVMTINSSAQPPAGTITPISSGNPSASASPTASASGTGNAVISGTINFNGSAPSGSSIVILAKLPTDAGYSTVVNGISPNSGSTWSWNGALTGATYNMVAVLKGQVNGDQNIDYADSQTYTVAAPAQNQLFTLNTGISMGAPTGSVWITCGTKGSNNVWSGNTVNFSSVSGAQYYSFQIGSTSGGSDIANISQAAQPLPSGVSNPAQTINVNNLNDSVIYYAQYAVASVTNPTPAQYSPYSGVYTLKCPN